MDTFKSFELLLPFVNADTFDEIALRLFRFQSQANRLYARYLQALQVEPSSVSEISQIPFLPIRFFKEHLLKTGTWQEEAFFESSGTTGILTSRHAVFSLQRYVEEAAISFESEFGPLKNFHLLAILPSYLERSNSSLIAMIDYFIKRTESLHSAFYLHNQKQLVEDVAQLKKSNRTVIVWGVTYALLDIAENFSPDWHNVLVFETGGMKGKRQEITREQLHEKLKSSLKIDKVFSEYGMTELLSQAYTKGGNLFYPSKMMKIVIREVTDPFRKGLEKQTGGINVIDLANFRTISFIETEDLGKIDKNGNFEVIGRLDNSDIRGCNLLVE